MIIASFTTVPLLLFSLSFAYVSHHICIVAAATSPPYPFLPLSLNSLDLAGVRLLSPRDSQITSKPDAGTDDTTPDDALKLKWEFDEDSRHYYVSLLDDQ